MLPFADRLVGTGRGRTSLGRQSGRDEMQTLKTLAAAKALALALVAGPAIAATAPAAPMPPAGDYKLDPAHTSVTFRVSHLGFSHYTARFSRIGGDLKFDPAHPAAM